MFSLPVTHSLSRWKNPLEKLLSMSRHEKLWIAATGGVVSHLCVFIWGEWHLYTPFLFLLYSSLSVIVVLAELFNAHEDAAGASATALMILLTYAISLFTSMIIYRVFFHPLRKFPGPLLGRISKLWHTYHSWDGKNYLFLDEMHRKYGSIVRTGPNELTLFSSDAMWASFGSKSVMFKSPWCVNTCQNRKKQ